MVNAFECKESCLILWFRFALEIMFVMIFTLEYLLKLVAHYGSWKNLRIFFTSWLNFIDLLAILPCYLDLILYPEIALGYQRFTVFRLVRLFRMLRFFRHSRTLQFSMDVLLVSLKMSAEALLSLFLFFIFFLVILSTLIYFAERGLIYPDDFIFDHVDFTIGSRPPIDIISSKFSSIPATFWYVLATMTTIGFGDMIPQSVLGKILSFPTMILGILVSKKVSVSLV